ERPVLLAHMMARQRQDRLDRLAVGGGVAEGLHRIELGVLERLAAPGNQRDVAAHGIEQVIGRHLALPRDREQDLLALRVGRGDRDIAGAELRVEHLGDLAEPRIVEDVVRPLIGIADALQRSAVGRERRAGDVVAGDPEHLLAERHLVEVIFVERAIPLPVAQRIGLVRAGQDIV
ncbi:hypothetical protein QU38_02370, partial [Staphylococcus aureus]